jgi:chain length determinant protein (polysaccharide antigen chain regulator)
VAQGEGRLQEANTLYLKGIKLLSAEIAALKERIKDSRFLRQVRLLEEENQTLNDLTQIELPKGTILAIDKPASVPQNPIAPNKKLILALSVVLGGMLGILYVLIRSALRNRQLKQSV